MTAKKTRSNAEARDEMAKIARELGSEDAALVIERFTDAQIETLRRILTD